MIQHVSKRRGFMALAIVGMTGFYVSAIGAEPAAADQVYAQVATPSTRPAAKPVDLHRVMESMERTLKRLQRQAKDEAQLESSLALVTELQQSTMLAKGAIPKQVEKLPPAEKTKAIADYRKMMGSVLQELVELETAMIDKDPKKIDEAISTIHDLEKSGHTDFKVDEH